MTDSIEQILPLASITSTSPILTREAFAQQVGLTAPTVYSMCDRGYLPVIHFGRRVFINLEALRLQANKKAQEFTL